MFCFEEKPEIIQTKPKINPKDETSLDGHAVDSSNESSRNIYGYDTILE